LYSVLANIKRSRIIVAEGKSQFLIAVIIIVRYIYNREGR
jgi:hypothetical protein